MPLMRSPMREFVRAFRCNRTFLIAAAGVLIAAAPALAAQPTPWQMDFQPPASEIKQHILDFHNYILLPMVFGVSLFVLALLVYIFVRFNAKANPAPSKTTHNTTLEVVWTVVPVIILFIIAVPSFRLLYEEAVVPKSDLTIKAIGKQWFWTYEYPDHGRFAFDSLMLTDAERKDPANQPRLLAVDNEVVVPVNRVVRVQVTAADVLHAWAMPAFGVKMDAQPGRLNETWFRATKTGVFYGQCSELCGKDHAFMPIQVRVVTEAEFTAWVEGARKKFARRDLPTDVAGDVVPAARTE
jgi:cytochrome c oxidase subunit 2